MVFFALPDTLLAQCGNTINWTDPSCQVIGSGNLAPWWTIVSRHGEYSQSETECNIPPQVTQSQGHVVITTISQNYTCGDWLTTGAVRTTPSSFPFKTGQFQWNTFNFTFGTITIKAKMPPPGTNLWPSWWLLGSNCQNSNKYSGDTGFGGCPNLGASGYREIDMIECYNSGGGCQFHVANPNFGIGNGCDIAYTWDANPHTWVLKWTSSQITLTMDGSLMTTCNQSITQPMFLINLIQTGGVGGTPTGLPASSDTTSVTVQDLNGNVIFSDPFDNQAPPPNLYFTDIITGANSGGENADGGLHTGVYVTLYGSNFGSAPTVTMNGVNCFRQPFAPTSYLWYQKLVVQLGSSCASGNIVVTTAWGSSSGIPFTVVPGGHIYFVAKTGNDNTGTGTFANPWATPSKAKNTMVAGDTQYVRAGTYDYQDNFGATIYCVGACTGTATAYQNFLGYPYETAVIGGTQDSRTALYNWGTWVMQYFTLGELTMRGPLAFTCQNPSGAQCNNLRIIANDMRATSANGVGFDMEMPSANVVFYGNESGFNCQGDPGCSFDARAYSMYLGGYGTQQNYDIGWNNLHDNPFGKGIQVYGHIAGDLIIGLKIHDNKIYNNAMVGVLLGGSDGGTDIIRDVQFYNNVLWNNSNAVGIDHMNYGGLAIQGGASLDVVNVYHNTFYNNSPAHTGVPAGGSIAFNQNGTHSTVVKDNVFYGTSGSPCYFYFDDLSSATRLNVTYSNNLYFGSGTGPNGCNNNVGQMSVNSDPSPTRADPKFVSIASLDFHLQSSSPAIAHGINVGILTDFDGIVRPTTPSIGAFEGIGGSSSGNVTGLGSIKISGSVSIN